MSKILNTHILNRLMGPIFDKELRACSRRRRYYLLRVVFVVLLLLFVIWTWLTTTSFASIGGSAAFTTMRMSVVSRAVVAVVVWLEFITMPLFAIVMMSDSIRQEINKRTLEILLSTPVTSLQIITGKIFGGLLQVLLLMAITLPLFSIIRVFGGVPWDFVVVSLCITLTTTCFLGAMSLYYSIQVRQSYKVIGWTLLTGLLIFGLIPGLVNTLNSYQNWSWLASAVHISEITNPFIGMAKITESIMASNPQGASIFAWKMHCLIIALGSLFILFISTIRLRRSMLSFSMDKVPRRSKLKRLRNILLKSKSNAVSRRELIEVKGNPILWKELRADKSENTMNPTLKNIILASTMAVVYICAAFFKVLTEPTFHAVIVTGMALFAFLRTAALSALSISKEKQSRTWPILLMTPIEEADILKMKAKAILRKTAFFWIIIFGDVIVFSLFLVLNPFSILAVTIAVVSTVFFLIGIGAYFGMRLKTTAGTMAATFAAPVVLWMLCPCSVNFSPLALIAVSVGIGMQEEGWMFSAIMAAVNLIPAIVYSVAGIIFLALAKASMRKYIFNI